MNHDLLVLPKELPIIHIVFAEESSFLHYKRITTFIGEPLLFQGVCLSKSNEQKQLLQSSIS